MAKIITENAHVLGLLNITNVHQYDYEESLALCTGFRYHFFKPHRPAEKMTLSKGENAREMTQFKRDSSREEIVARYLLGECISCFQISSY